MSALPVAERWRRLARLCEEEAPEAQGRGMHGLCDALLEASRCLDSRAAALEHAPVGVVEVLPAMIDGVGGEFDGLALELEGYLDARGRVRSRTSASGGAS